MKIIKELATLIHPQKLESSIFGLDLNGSSEDLMTLFNGVLQGQFHTDEEARALLFPDEESSQKYRKLKTKLRWSLKNAVLYFNEKDNKLNEYQKAYYACHKDWATVKILITLNAVNSAVNIALGAYRKAKRYEFNHLARDIASFLSLHYANRRGNLEKFEWYNTQKKTLQALVHQEEQAQEMYCRLVLQLVHKKAFTKGKGIIASEAVQALDHMMSEKPSFQLQQYYFLIKLLDKTASLDALGTIKVCHEAVDCFSKKSFKATVPLKIFYFHQLSTFIQLRRYEEAYQVVDKCFKLVEEGKFNWFKFYEIYFLLAIHTSEYELAFEIFRKITTHAKFQFLSPRQQGVWKIFQAKLYLLYRLDRLKEEPLLGKRNIKFKLGKFKNETAIFSKDKKGLNASVLIAELSLLIVEGKLDQFIDRLDATRLYAYRHLQTETTNRCFRFFLMFVKLQKEVMTPGQLQLHSDQHLNAIDKLPENRPAVIELEIIPYEQLWEYLISSILTFEDK